MITLKDIQGNDNKLELLRVILSAACERGESIEPMLFICSNRDYILQIAEAIAGELCTKYSIITELPTSSDKLIQLLMGKEENEVVIFNLHNKITKTQELLLVEAIRKKELTAKIGRKDYVRELTLSLSCFIPVFLICDTRSIPERLRNSFDVEIRWDNVSQEYYLNRVRTQLEDLNIELQEQTIRYLAQKELSDIKLKKICARIKDFKEIGCDQEETDLIKTILGVYE